MILLNYLIGKKNEGDGYRGRIVDLREQMENAKGPMIMIFDNTGLSSDVIRTVTGSGKKDGYSHSALVINDNGEYKICEAVNEFPFGLLKGRSGYIKIRDLEKGLKYANKIAIKKVVGANADDYTSRKLTEYAKDLEGSFNRFDNINLGKYFMNRVLGTKLKQKRREKKNCTSLAIDAIHDVYEIDVTPDGKEDKFVTPQELAESKKLGTIYELSF